MTNMRRHTQNTLHLGAHGEVYGNWMSASVFWLLGGTVALAAALAAFFAALSLEALTILFLVITALLMILLLYLAWVRWQYAFGGGGLMEEVHRTILSHLDFDGKGTLLEVGCGSGALSIRAALTWPESKVLGLDSWGAMYCYSQALCESNAEKEGVAGQCTFCQGDANKLDLPDGSVDAVVSNYVYHNIVGADRQALLLETLRVLKKGGVFALNDTMKPSLYGDMEAFAQKLRTMGYEEVTFVDTASEAFGSPHRAARYFLGSSRMLVGRK